MDSTQQVTKLTTAQLRERLREAEIEALVAPLRGQDKARAEREADAINTELARRDA
jgi:hypothetical protein